MPPLLEVIMAKKEKKKKEKVIYYDDNSTIADMSCVTRDGKKRPPQQPKMQSSFGEKWKTYWNAVKMMVVPMCAVLIGLIVLYLFLMLISGNLV